MGTTDARLRYSISNIAGRKPPTKKRLLLSPSSASMVSRLLHSKFWRSPMSAKKRCVSIAVSFKNVVWRYLLCRLSCFLHRKRGFSAREVRKKLSMSASVVWQILQDG